MLYLIATPIGNLGDLTHRAIETMREADYLLCEDTRYSLRLLTHYGIHKPLKSFHAFNEAKKEDPIIADLKNGSKVCLLTDAGTPGISDPGHRLVARCRKEQIPVTSLPGPCAAITALSLSSFSSERFQFVGFLPRKSAQMQRLFLELLDYPGTSICYESPYRLVKALQILASLQTSHRVAVARELTKTFEEYREGTAQELLAHFEKKGVKGEIVLLISRE